MAIETEREVDAPDVSDPVQYFVDDMRYHGRTERTRRAYERVLRRFETFVRDEYDIPLDAVPHRVCMAWIHRLRPSVSESTLATYASYLHRFYAYMVQVGIFSSNPMALVVEEMTESIDANPSRRELSVDEMASFVRDVTHPLERSVILTLLKTGMRAGELCNLDVRDLNVSDIDALENRDVRPQLHGKPNSLFVSAAHARGVETNGDVRTASNKRRRDTIVPVDDELAATLERWMAIRPDPRSAANPLFTSTNRAWGCRITPDIVHHLVKKHASERGWYREGQGVTENVTPHYFRHFFTTHLRNRAGDRGIVTYLRGDVSGDIVDTYTHNWGNAVRETYEAHIYRLL